MLIPYDALIQLPADTLKNLIREYLLTQVEDGGFDSLGETHLEDAIARCKDMLKRGELVVEYSEDNDSVGIRHKSSLPSQQSQD
ncbi:YheU family protein [Shewanella litorisediminis]|uniref:YheU family protein n=1 Tax=Shewanella litorisediminis TaxID=1173586 RepID=A0ABX7G1P8_9GAMM|nr:YheU family protein [Shewanella litorisediminis]MCL2918391.1 YheU family protein [Shewanella litorisediminis]QRH01229.1 YheU family protein [Shewanella litorisediminis]